MLRMVGECTINDAFPDRSYLNIVRSNPSDYFGLDLNCVTSRARKVRTTNRIAYVVGRTDPCIALGC